MAAQFRASDEDWSNIERCSVGNLQVAYRCIHELRDRVICMDACIRDIYDTLDVLNKRCNRNYIKASEVNTRVEKLEQLVSNPEQLPKRGINLADAVLAGADGPAPVAEEGSLLQSAALALLHAGELWADEDAEIAGESERLELVQEWKPYARAAILAVADWMEDQAGDLGSVQPEWWIAQMLRREVEQ